MFSGVPMSGGAEGYNTVKPLGPGPCNTGHLVLHAEKNGARNVQVETMAKPQNT